MIRRVVLIFVAAWLAPAAPALAGFEPPFSDGGGVALVRGGDGAMWGFYNSRDGPPLTKGFIRRITADGSVRAFDAFQGAIAGIGAGPDGAIWFTGVEYGRAGQQNRNRVARIDSSGAVSNVGAPLAERPGPIVAGPDRNLWIGTTGQIVRMTPDGDATSFSVAGAAFGPQRIVSAADGNLWFAYGDQEGVSRLGRVTPQGAVTTFDDVFATTLTAGADRRLWAAAGLSLFRIELDGTASLVGFGTIKGGGPKGGAGDSFITSTALGPDGNVWFAESNFFHNTDLHHWHRVGFVTPEGSVYEMCPSLPVQDIALGPDGRMWITSPKHRQVLRVTADTSPGTGCPAEVRGPTMVPTGPAPKTRAKVPSRVRRGSRPTIALRAARASTRTRVKAVEVALRLTRRSGSCVWSTAAGRFVRPEFDEICADPALGDVFVRAKRKGSRWTFRPRRALQPGRYEVFSRAIDALGRTERTFATSRNRRTFVVRGH